MILVMYTQLEKRPKSVYRLELQGLFFPSEGIKTNGNKSMVKLCDSVENVHVTPNVAGGPQMWLLLPGSVSLRLSR